jgi:hypothetical protein
MKLTTLIYTLIFFTLIYSCKKEKHIEEETTSTVAPSTSNIRYDIEDFTITTFSNRKEYPFMLEETADGAVIGIVAKQDLSNRIVKSSNPYTNNWQEVYSVNERIYDIKVASNGDIFAVSQSGLLKSTNNGTTWTNTLFTNDIVWNDNIMTMRLWVNGTDILISRNWGNHSFNDLFLSTNNGVTFTKVLSTPSNQEFIRGMIVTPGVYLAFRQGDILRSDDAGNTWTTVLNGSWAIFNGFYDNITNTLFAGTDNTIYTSNDLGVSWTSTNSDFMPAIKMSNGDYVSSKGGVGIVRSNDNGVSWLALGGVKNSIDDILEFQGNKLIAHDASGLYILPYGNTAWDYLPQYQPQSHPTNYGAKSVYSFNGQLFVSSDQGLTWTFTMSFTDDVVFASRMGTGKIIIITENSLGLNHKVHVINSAGSLIEETYNIPWTGKVENFVSNGIKIAAIFKGSGNSRDYISWLEINSGTWTTIFMATKYHKIHFIDKNTLDYMYIGYESSNGNNYQNIAGSSFDLFFNNNQAPTEYNYVNTGWPGLYIYDQVDRIMFWGEYGLAFFGNDLYISKRTGSDIKWYKSLNFQTFDASKQAVLKNAVINNNGHIVTSLGDYTSPLVIREQ